MKKSLFFAFALVASVLVFVACDKKDNNEAEETTTSSTIPGVKFVCDYEREGGYGRETIYFELENDFEWTWEWFEDAARTKLVSDYNDYGIYELNEEEQYIDMTFLGSFDTYKLDGDTLYLTTNVFTDKFVKK